MLIILISNTWFGMKLMFYKLAKQSATHFFFFEKQLLTPWIVEAIYKI